MAICPFATQHLLPESHNQPKIVPTQVIDHTIVGTVQGTDGYFRNKTNLETHFGITDTGVIWQWMDTDVRADGNFHANRRPDGTGAVSIETEGYASEPWTDAQVDALVRLHTWLAGKHDHIGHRICRTPSDPGFGYHTLFGAPGEWTPVSKDCPGKKRIKQWRDVVVPRTLAALASREPDPGPDPHAADRAALAKIPRTMPHGLHPDGDKPSAKPLQELLSLAGYPVDGRSAHYGPETQHAVVDFHHDHPQYKARDVAHDPAIGPDGWHALYDIAAHRIGGKP